MKTLLRPAAASRLLTDFVSMPVGMLPASHLGFIRELHAGRFADGAAIVPRASLTPGNQTVNEWWVDGMAGPWTQPIYEIDAATGIGLLEITGPLIKGYDDFTAWWYECASIDRIDRSIGELSNRADLRGLVVALNTPGGMNVGMPEATAKLAALAQRIPVYCYTADQAASNGMRFAVSGSKFLPTASSIVGCIGTYIAFYNYTKFLEDMGIKLELYRAGKYKAIGLEGKDTSPEEATFIQGEVQRGNEIFREFVRAQYPQVEDESMEGQWFDGARAVDLHLATDIVTGLPEVLQRLRAEIGA